MAYAPPNRKRQAFDAKKLSEAEAAAKLKRDQIASCYDRHTTPQKAYQIAQEKAAIAEACKSLDDDALARFDDMLADGTLTLTVLS